MLLKACGITRREDAAAACELGYGAIGLVFAESPRRVDPGVAREICYAVPSSVLKVGVFVREDPGEVRRIMEHCGLDLVQLHGGEDPGEFLRFGDRAIAALHPRSPEDLANIGDYRGVYAVLIDTWDPLVAGGTGRTCDWGLAARAALSCRVILAGGLNAANVGEAVRRVRPFGVDVSSGVESSPGRKDNILMREFALAAAGAGREVSEEERGDERTSGD